MLIQLLWTKHGRAFTEIIWQSIRGQKWVVLSMVMDLWVPEHAGNLLSRKGNIRLIGDVVMGRLE
jgi:hypothetical protein